MKLSLFTISISLLYSSSFSFVSQPVTVRNSLVLNAVELTPEPEGGDVLTSLKTMEGSRMKNMGEVEGVKDEHGTVYKFWLTATAEGALVKKLNTEVLKDASKKAEFPGFRKGQIPPYAMPQIRVFSVQEGIIQTVQSAVDAYGLKSISGSNGEVQVLEDIAEIAKDYKVGDDIQFTATLNAIFDPEQVAAKDDKPADDSVIDVEVEESA
eukprot:scaffold3513_cov102-Cylindrotheca_fusiformis.AAC.9